MNTQAIAFTASEQTLTKTSGADYYASNTIGYIEAAFDLDENWDGFDSVRAVWKSQYYTISAVLNAQGVCLVPAEVKYYKSKVFVNLVGSNVEDDVLVDRLTTYPILAFTIDAEAEVEGTETTDITPSQFEQFVDQVEGYAESAAEDAQSIAESAAQIEQNAEDIADLKEEINDKPNWTVGSAEQIVSDEASQTDVTPYTFRRSGGGLIPFNFTREELSKVVGGTVAWNQLANKWRVVGQPISEAIPTNIAITLSANGQIDEPAISIPVGHKLLTLFSVKASSDFSGNVSVRNYITGSSEKAISVSTTETTYGLIETVTSNSNSCNFIARNVTAGSVTFNNLQLTDLTALFSNPAIADYVYSLEQATAGAGVAWLKTNFPKLFDSYKAYDPGSLQSVCVGAHECVGFNCWDEEWELGTINASTGQNDPSTTKYRCKNYIHVFPNTEYYFRATAGTTYNLFFYDADKNFLSVTGKNANSTFTTPENAWYMRFYKYTNDTEYDNDITLNISKTTGTPKNGDYVPYNGHTYALDSTKTLRGRFYLDSNNQLRADGDIYLPSGKINRTYGEYTFTGSETWTWFASSQFWYMPLTGVNTINNKIKTSNGIVVKSNSQNQIQVYPSDNPSIGESTNMNTVFPSGTTIVYSLVTPTTETADPYTAVQICDSDGTEEFVDALVEAGTRDVAIPAGTETVYYEDMASKLAELPPIPSAPSANGTYTLQAVVSSGAVTYSWTS